ncbi:MAG TPA: acyclic terpene utilization AtuA family protein [Phenylobacterium sp.]|jgi:hypothetical protein|uniref:acyclic terpene utilization AtuA family protein n=1 Tax=Phenylobacterium sp. TaxID=1871053 RepID=UPI002B800CE5|nr:acyclic terpene utilization AtuA family protein [Phenylobacterium sp.]HXA40559.1 acyclic terpene utilization AtuA family protein [Phenylobacterium sp.]
MGDRKPAGEAIKVIVPTGALGAGVSAEHVRYGIERGAHAIACDAGSTDSGPAYLARGVSKMPAEAIRHDLRILIAAAHDAGIPLLIGSCGTSGTDAGVDWTAEIAVEVARELGIRPRIALLYSEQSPVLLKARNDHGRIHPLAPLGPVSNETLDSCQHIVALMGAEPYIRAVREGADIVLGGRTTDTAILASVPLMHGKNVAAAWHAAKVTECGGQCTVHPRTGGVIFSVDDEGFDVEPLNLKNQCSPESVSAHMLYESSDPIRLTEPGGVLDVSESRYEWLDERTTRVTGSRWEPMPYTMKLEGAGAGRFQSIMLIGIEDPEVLANLNLFEEGMLRALDSKIRQTFGDEAGDFDVSLRIYGWNGVSGRPMPDTAAPPHEVGVMFVVTAATQSLANRMAKACNPTFFHLPLKPGIEMPSYAFPFTPAEIERGQLYEFRLNHVVETADGFELVRTRWIDVADPQPEAAAHG